MFYFHFYLDLLTSIEKKVNNFLRRWLGIPPSFTSVGLYIRSGQLQLPISSISEEFKVAKCRLVMTLRDSRDEKVSQAGVRTRSGRKWAAADAVDSAEGSLRIRDIIGNPCIARQGLGMTHFQQYKTANPGTRRDMVQKEIRDREDELRRSRAVELGSQGVWTSWDLPQRKVTWAELWRLEPFRISFLLRSVYDTLPTPTNLQRYGLVDDPSCQLCGEKGTLAHILSGCKTALTQGRYRWRHDKVLAALAHALDQERRKKREDKGSAKGKISFVREGVKPARIKPTKDSILQSAKAWEFAVDLKKKLYFPSVVQTTLRPDAVLWSPSDKKIIIIELTVPWEEGCMAAHERKQAKYQELVTSCREKGWQAWLFPVEVGCRGFPAQSVWKLLSALGMQGKEKRKLIRKLGEEAEKASCWLWNKRSEKQWTPGGDK